MSIQTEFVMEGMPRVWRVTSRYSRVTSAGLTKVGSYTSWLRWADGLGNGGVRCEGCGHQRG
jgi:hypothetical protein